MILVAVAVVERASIPNTTLSDTNEERGPRRSDVRLVPLVSIRAYHVVSVCFVLNANTHR